MEKGIKNGVKLINDVSGINYDPNSISILKKYKTPFVLQHSLGTPDVMQNNPKYKNVLCPDHIYKARSIYLSHTRTYD